ncbi:huntingtin-interacting protein 1 [Platysternon megacephalum]|uniref:Huntingtin-interacting protein 1 n=1 Tax=Platysternon megacephalum TaxID=55544 RepID=A0A4D9DWQ7_9SAUR|nr:huntingtin-interacting protein 1 [Platysternon megacephalum]
MGTGVLSGSISSKWSLLQVSLQQKAFSKTFQLKIIDQSYSCGFWTVTDYIASELGWRVESTLAQEGEIRAPSAGASEPHSDWVCVTPRLCSVSQPRVLLHALLGHDEVKY